MKQVHEGKLCWVYDDHAGFPSLELDGRNLADVVDDGRFEDRRVRITVEQSEEEQRVIKATDGTSA